MICAVRLVLASASPRRAELLSAAGVLFETISVEVDERAQPGEDPAAYVDRLAREKSACGLAVLSNQRRAGDVLGDDVTFGDRHRDPEGRVGPPDVVVLGADTTVVVDGVMFGKPADAGDAARMLRELSGRTHSVLTGVSLRNGSGAERSAVATTAVEFTTLTPEDIEWYVCTGEGIDKAGAYAIQGLASRFVTRIDGSYSNVVGLPVAAVFELARLAGWTFENAPAKR
jgi:septum formation protein